jgi:hypothetical protein
MISLDAINYVLSKYQPENHWGQGRQDDPKSNVPKYIKEADYIGNTQ